MACAQLIPGDPLSTPHRISRDGIEGEPWRRSRLIQDARAPRKPPAHFGAAYG